MGEEKGRERNMEKQFNSKSSSSQANQLKEVIIISKLSSPVSSRLWSLG